MQNRDYSLTPAATAALLAAVRNGTASDDFAFNSNHNPAVHLHARRWGPAKGGLASRVALSAHNADGTGAALLVSSAEARQIAAQILDLADEIDGVTALVFNPAAANRAAQEVEAAVAEIEQRVSNAFEDPEAVLAAIRGVVE